MTTANLLVNFFVLLTTRVAFASATNPDQLIKVTGRRIYLTGQTLVLNCTAITNSYNNRNLSWTKDGKELQAKTIGNDTLQIVKHKVISTDGGGYRCVVRQRTRVLRSVSVHVIVGDTPSRPTNTTWTQVDSSICLHWSPVITGNIPVTYRVRYHCISECNFFYMMDSTDKWHYAACKTAPLHPGRILSCCINGVDLFVGFEAVVEATNIFGTSSSTSFNFTRDIQVTPGPPRSLKVLAEGYSEISLSWTNSHTLIGWPNVKYIIYYSAQGDKQNKTITTDSNGQNYYRITGLKPYTKYIIYLAAIDPIFKNVGIPVGPVTIVTREENPSDAPEITEWHSVIYPDNRKLRNVSMYWKLPHKEKWNGRITKYIIQYRRIPRSEEIEATSANSWGQYEVIDNSSTTEGTIVGLRIDSAYNVDMQMCNQAGCGGIGNRIIIKAITEPIKEQIKQENSKSIVILCVALVAILVILLAMVIVIFKFKRTQHTESSKTDSLFYVNDSQCLDLKGAKV